MIEAEEKASVLPAKENISYGLFGFEGAMCDRAIRSDNKEMLMECIKKGFINADSKTLFGDTIVKHADRFCAKQCATYLRELGWK